MKIKNKIIPQAPANYYDALNPTIIDIWQKSFIKALWIVHGLM